MTALLPLLLLAGTGIEPPVVLVPGFLGFDALPAFGRYAEPTVRALEARGDIVVIARPLPVASPAEHADAVVAAIDEALAQSGADVIVIVAHSRGGLDVRAALDRPGVRARVGAVATLATPHHGTPVASFARRLPDVVVDGALQVVHAAWQEAEIVPHATRRPADVAGAIEALSPGGARAFHAAHPDPGVPFFSIAGVTGPLPAADTSCDGGRWGRPLVADDAHGGLLFPSAAHLVESVWDATDGVVPAASARFGTFLGCAALEHGDWLSWHDNPWGRAAVVDERLLVLALVDGLRASARRGAPAMEEWIPQLARLAGAAPPPRTAHHADVDARS